MNNGNYGSLWLQSIATFTRHLSPEEETRQLLSVLTETPTPAPTDTDPASITNCIQLGTLYKVEARTLAWRVLLRFDPSDPSSGGYEFYVPAEHLNETGSIHNVTKIEGQNQYLHMYAPTAAF